MKNKFKDDIDKKISVLDPKFKKQLHDLFKNIHNSVSVLYEAATRDEKTGLYNNKFFNNVFEMEFEKAKRGQQKLCLFIIDIDYFKKINDTYGHIKADDILKKLALLLKKQTRKSDVVARFGGEEFFILLPETSLEKAKRLTKRLREAIKSDKFLKKYNLTVSGGLTEFRKKDTKRALKERTDKSLYQAKETGRDKIVAVR